MDGEGEGYGVDLLSSRSEEAGSLSKYRIVPESDFTDDSEMRKRTRHPMKCNLTVQPPPASKGFFSYNRFAHYVQMKSEVERCERIVKVLSSQEDSVLKLEYYSDAILKQELTNLYGAMDESSNKFLKLFQNYKEERHDQLQQWIADENNLRKKMRDEVDSGFHGQIDVPNLQDWFTVDEIIAFDKVSIPHLVKTDHFVLPRPIKGEQDILDDYIRVNGGTPNGGQQLKLNNLCAFDPDLNVREVVIPEISNTTVGDMLQSKMLAIIEDNPAGISSQAFLTEFKNRNQYYPQPKSMNYPNIPTMMEALGEHVIHIQHIECLKISFYFPMCLQGLVNSPRIMLWNIWHKLRIAVRLYHGIVRISTCFRFCEKLFGWKPINWKAWGFTSQFDLVQCFIREFGECGVKVMAECEFKPTGRTTLWFLIEVNNDQVDQYIEQYSSSVPEKEIRSSVGRGFNADKMVRSSTKKYESQPSSSPTPVINHPTERPWGKIEPTKLNMNQTSSEAFPSLQNSQQHSQSKRKGTKWKALPNSLGDTEAMPRPHPTNKETTWSSLLKK